MTQNTTKWVRRIYYALITLALITVAVLLMMQCVAIKKLGDHPFTIQRIAEHFAPIAVPVYVCLGLVAVGFALSPILPAAPDSAPDRDAVTLRRLQAKTDLELCPEELTRDVRRQRRARNRHYYVTLTLLAVGTAAFLWYTLDLSRYSMENKNGSVIQNSLALLACAIVPFLYGIFTAYFCRHSVKTEIELLRTAPKAALSSTPATEAKTDWAPFVQKIVFCVAVGFIVYGLLIGGAAEVLGKALKICTECIGLG